MKDLSPVLSFRERVFAIVAQIPEGEAMTYKEVAMRAGNPLAARAVGAIMRTNYNESIPCHRVVRSDGKPSGYNRGGWEKKTERLRTEGYLR